MSVLPLASNALTTLEDVKAMLGISPDEDNDPRDSVLVMLINAASAWAERVTDRKFALQTYTKQYEGSGTQSLVLDHYPVTDVEYVKDITDGGLFDESEYNATMYAESGIIHKDTIWPYRGYAVGLANDLLIPRHYIEVRYTAGYILPKDATEDEPSNLPYDLQSVVWGIVAKENTIMTNGAHGLSAFSISDVSWTFDKAPNPAWMDTLEYYKRRC